MSSSSRRRAARTWSRPSPPPRPASTSSSRSRWRSPLERCDRIIDACDKNKRQALHHLPVALRRRQRRTEGSRDGGRFGRLTLGETTCKWWREQSYYDEGGWKGTQALDGGGALMNQAIHNVDLLLWMMGDVTHVMGFTATLAHERIEVEDTAVACLRFKSGALGVIQATTSVWPGLPEDDRRPRRSGLGRHRAGRPACAGTSRRRSPTTSAIRAAVRPEGRRVGRLQQSRRRSRTSATRAATRRLRRRRSRRTGAPLVDGREGRKAVEVILGIYAANKTGKPVALVIDLSQAPP